jgi:hypothetical protein
MKIKDITKDKNGNYPSHAWPGGYPIYYLDSGANDLCPSCANKFMTHSYAPNRPIAFDIHYEGSPIQCDECNAQIESAYGDPDQDAEDRALDLYVSELERTYNQRAGK